MRDIVESSGQNCLFHMIWETVSSSWEALISLTNITSTIAALTLLFLCSVPILSSAPKAYCYSSGRCFNSLVIAASEDIFVSGMSRRTVVAKLLFQI